MYSSALDPSSALPETIFSDKDPLHSMEGKWLATLEQALAELQAKDANTQHKLDILISHIPQSENPIPSTQPTPVTPKAHSLKPAIPLEFDGDHTKGMAFLNSCQVYICLCVKLGIWTEMLGPKSCEVLASTCQLHRSLDGCLEFWRSGWSRRVWSRAEKKLNKGESELREVGC